MPLRKIVSGGQTGVDRAALDIAIELGIPHGGFCPLGRRAEDGIIPSKYNLIEYESIEYATRTLKNVLSSDGTLILHYGIISHGTALTKKYCIQENKPLKIINILGESKSGGYNFTNWQKENSIQVLNIAGPRKSENGNYELIRKILYELFYYWKIK